jgi:hypothetical protein
MVFLSQSDRLAAVFRLGDHFHPCLFLDQRLEPVPDDLVIISNQNPYGGHLSSLPFSSFCMPRGQCFDGYAWPGLRFYLQGAAMRFRRSRMPNRPNPTSLPKSHLSGKDKSRHGHRER